MQTGHTGLSPILYKPPTRRVVSPVSVTSSHLVLSQTVAVATFPLSGVEYVICMPQAEYSPANSKGATSQLPLKVKQCCLPWPETHHSVTSGQYMPNFPIRCCRRTDVTVGDWRILKTQSQTVCSQTPMTKSCPMGWNQEMGPLGKEYTTRQGEASLVDFFSRLLREARSMLWPFFM